MILKRHFLAVSFIVLAHVSVLAVEVPFQVHSIESVSGDGTQVIDFDGDGDLDLCTRFDMENGAAWYENDGERSYTRMVIEAGFAGTPGLFLFDIDIDGDIDAFARQKAFGRILYYENDGR